MENDRNDYVVIKALENGVSISGITRGRDTKLHHTEKIDRNEILITQFTEQTAAIKIRGKVELYTKHGVIKSEE